MAPAIPLRLKVTIHLKVIAPNSSKLNIFKNNVGDLKNNLTTKQKIPKPNTVETWLGPKPPDAALLEAVPNKTSFYTWVIKKYVSSCRYNR